MIDIVAAYTSKLAYDGSGNVKRDSKNYALAAFSYEISTTYFVLVVVSNHVSR